MGYPVIHDRSNGGDRHLRVNHISFEIHQRKLRKGEQANHTCDNPRCVNPDHIYAGTQAQNMRDMWNRGRAPVATLFQRTTTPATRKRIVRLYATGCYSQRDLAKQFHLSQGGISKIILEANRTGENGWKARQSHLASLEVT